MKKEKFSHLPDEACDASCTHDPEESNVCGALIHVGIEGNTTCANPKKGCIMHDPEAKKKWFDDIEKSQTRPVPEASVGEVIHQNNWIKEFDDKFSDLFGHGGEEHVKNFISKHLAMEYARGRREQYREDCIIREQQAKSHEKDFRVAMMDNQHEPT
jgi:hypothetical protein